MNPIISLLSDGEFHSGEKIAALLGISRTAVWKQLKKLEESSIAVESVKGKGYRLPGGLELLDREVILRQLDRAASEELRLIETHHELESTNAYLLGMGLEGHAAVCLAERQTQGRGRRGRNWVSPYGRNIYLSAGWMFEGGAASLEGLSLAVGIAVRRGCARCCDVGADLGLKWPNDLLFQGRKLAGILLEMTGDPQGVCQVVAGIGVNIGMSEAELASIDQPCADARELGIQSRNSLVAAILNELIIVLKRFENGGFSGFVEEWNRYDLTFGKPVTLSTPTSIQKGTARGVSETGALLLETDGRLQQVNGGEISLRFSP